MAIERAISFVSNKYKVDDVIVVTNEEHKYLVAEQVKKFKNIYTYAHSKGLKGCTTFRFNPDAFQGVLVKEEDLKNTTYVFTLEDGTEVKTKGDE